MGSWRRGSPESRSSMLALATMQDFHLKQKSLQQYKTTTTKINPETKAKEVSHISTEQPSSSKPYSTRMEKKQVKTCVHRWHTNCAKSYRTGTVNKQF